MAQGESDWSEPRREAGVPAEGFGMNSDTERKVRERAYELWVEGGRPHGKSDDYWVQAEREVHGRNVTGTAATSAKSSAANTKSALKAPGRGGEAGVKASAPQSVGGKPSGTKGMSANKKPAAPKDVLVAKTSSAAKPSVAPKGAPPAGKKASKPVAPGAKG